MNSITLNQSFSRGNTSPAENIQRRVQQNLRNKKKSLHYTSDNIQSGIITFFFPIKHNQSSSRDRISSARKSRYRTDEIVKTSVEQISNGTANLYRKVSDVTLNNNIRNSIFCYDIIKKILERYVLKDCLSSLTTSILGDVTFV